MATESPTVRRWRKQSTTLRATLKIFTGTPSIVCVSTSDFSR
jgi:hypothetical protein